MPGIDSPSGKVRHSRPLNPTRSRPFMHEQAEFVSLYGASLSEVQCLYNEALVAQKTMQHVRSVAQQASHSIRKARRHQVVRVKLLKLLITPLWHEAEGAGLNIVSVPRRSASEAPKILAAVQRRTFRHV